MDFDYRKNFFCFYTTVLKEYKKFSSKTFGKYDLTPAEVDVLTFLMSNSPEFNTSSSISQYIGISKGLVSRSVHSLSEKGILSMEVNPEDKRSSLLVINPEFKELLDSIYKDDQDFKDMLLKNLSQDDLDKFFQVNETILHNLEEFKRTSNES